MHPHRFTRRWDGTLNAASSLRRLRVDPTSPSRLLRKGHSSMCPGCDHRVDWHLRADHRPLGLHPGELPTRAVPEEFRWHLSGGVAHRHADAPWCRIPHTLVCPQRTLGDELTGPLTELRRRMAVHTRRRIDAGLFTPTPPHALPGHRQRGATRA
ncbi:DUF6083 domain-containing protein, partial [Streptomyces nigrescens]